MDAADGLDAHQRTGSTDLLVAPQTVAAETRAGGRAHPMVHESLDATSRSVKEPPREFAVPRPRGPLRPRSDARLRIGGRLARALTRSASETQTAARGRPPHVPARR